MIRWVSRALRRASIRGDFRTGARAPASSSSNFQRFGGVVGLGIPLPDRKLLGVEIFPHCTTASPFLDSLLGYGQVSPSLEGAPVASLQTVHPIAIGCPTFPADIHICQRCLLYRAPENATLCTFTDGWLLSDACHFLIATRRIVSTTEWYPVRGYFSGPPPVDTPCEGEGLSAMAGAAEVLAKHNGGEKGKRGGPVGEGLQTSSEPTILREGDADILLHGNDVFYNKAQIVNRDLSLAVLRAFSAKRQEEHENSTIKKATPPLNQNGTVGETTGSGDSHFQLGDASVSFPSTVECLDSNQLVSEGAETALAGTERGEATREDNVESAAAGNTEAVPVADGNAVSIPSISEPSKAKPLHILEALAASGLRALRYAKEVEEVGSVVACDIDKVAVEACERNIRLNGKVAMAKLTAHHADARIYMLSHEKEFDVVDLDPYGSPSMFLDSAVQSVSEGGLLMCTATDMAVLCGNNGEVCYTKYGAYPLRGKYCHEMGLRILLASIEGLWPQGYSKERTFSGPPLSHANRYKRHIIPVLALSVDFYVRVFVRIYTSASAIKETPSKLSYVYQCVGCDSFHLQPVGRTNSRAGSTRYLPGSGPVISPSCKQCGKHHNMGGPIWSAPMHDPEWISSMLTNVTAMKHRYPAFDKVHSILTAVSEEMLDVPLYVSLHSMSATLKCIPPSSTLFRSAVVNAGYHISGTHANPLGLKTDAPMEVLWDIMRCWVKDHPVKDQGRETSGKVILSKQPEIEANFKKAPAALSKALAAGVARFLPNPEEFWGPKPRAGRHLSNKHIASHGAAFVSGSVCAQGEVMTQNANNIVDEATEAKRQKRGNVS